MDESIILFFSAVIVFGGILFAVISLTKKGSGKLNVDYYRANWLKIENRLAREQESTYQICVLDADKLLDHALRHKGIKGKTMSERLKGVSKTLSDRNATWSAHKLRNQIAHEPNVKVAYNDARHALNGIKRALKDLRAI